MRLTYDELLQLRQALRDALTYVRTRTSRSKEESYTELLGKVQDMITAVDTAKRLSDKP